MLKSIGKIFSSEDHTCPWWLCFTFDNPARGLMQNPYRILGDYIKPDDTVLDIGPGMGYFTFPMAEMAGENGRVIALDIQEGMLKRLDKKISKTMKTNIVTKLYDGIKFDLHEKFDFVLLFWMFHEVRNKNQFITEIESVMKPGSRLFIAEPKFHVSKKKFDASIKLLTDIGFKKEGEPPVSLSRTALLNKK